MSEKTFHLRNGRVGVLFAQTGEQLPAIVHWGADLGALDADDLGAATALVRPGPAPSSPDARTLPSLSPEYSRGHAGTPGVVVSRTEAAGSWSPQWRTESVVCDGTELRVRASDEALGIDLEARFVLEPGGLLRVRHELRNAGDRPVDVRSVTVTLPVAGVAEELLDLTGRWGRERAPQRRRFGHGRWSRPSRRGRTGHDASIVLAAGTPGFDFATGEVWAVHLAWSGDHDVFAERGPDPYALIGGAELLGPAEVVLAAGESYRTPWLLAAWSDAGLDGISARFHDWFRGRPAHPTSPRPVTLNTWEATYYDHDRARLSQLVKTAAGVGVERFVLDDGWFRGRRDDAHGLGDWQVDAEVWPDGLADLIEEVHDHGMEFGLWVEPEMISPDSDLARAHPDWVLADGDRTPPSWRHQQVLDLSNPDAYAHVRDQLVALVTEYDIAALKWDHNRDLIDAGHGGRPAVHRQTLAAYRLMAEVRRARPGLEIESCASGGARVDAGVAEVTDRFWPSDCNDPVERAMIQRWTSLLVPPELLGSHVGPEVSHTTGRHTGLDLRAVTALFGSMGIEWDLTDLAPDQLERLAAWISAYRSHRDLLHSGRVFRTGGDDPGLLVHGVVAADHGEALVALVPLRTTPEVTTLPLRIPGLSAERRYRIDRVLAAEPGGRVQPWPWPDGLVAPGSVLTRSGVVIPWALPQSAHLIHLVAVPDDLPDDSTPHDPPMPAPTQAPNQGENS
ncbi:MAG: alpha-galactosidase [Nocardioides sp.]|uniref:alpha-galactosidase n=1 Tax=Nocardioides sp. TaxID=35761 RepID=UPI0039E5A318